MGKIMLARLMESQKWHLPVGSVVLCGEGSEEGQWPLLTLMPDTSVSPWIHTTGAFQATTPALEFRGSKFEVSLCVGSLKGTAGNPAVSSTNSIPAGFYNQKL